MPKRHISAEKRNHEPLDPTDALRERFAAIRDELEVPGDFPDEVIAAAEAVGRLAGLDLPERDETGVPFITIDPPGSMDLDQAVHIEEVDGPDATAFRVRYAITDLPAFVTPGGAIDREALRRGQTIYAPDQRTPLHPPILSEGVASLLPEQTVPAFVWDFAVGADGEVLEQTVYRAMVRSVGRTDYETVQNEVDSGTATGTVAALAKVGPLRMERELARGGASLPMPEQRVLKNEDGTYTVEFRPALPCEEWNAQISLMTGMAAADIMLRHKVGILRTLPDPSKETVARFRRSAKACEVPWEKDVSYGEFLRSLDRKNPRHLALIFEATVLFRGSGYTFMRGEVPAERTHAAVAAPYAHVTAPLRRLVDRYGLIIAHALENGETVPQWVTDTLPRLPDIMRETDRRSNAVERASADAVEAAVLQGTVGETYEVIVVDKVGRGDNTDLIVKLLEPAVVTRASGSADLGETVEAELVEASIETSTVRFAVAGAS